MTNTREKSKVHHMTLKLADSHGLRIVTNGDLHEVRTQNGDHLVADHADAKIALQQAIALIEAYGEENDVEEFDDMLSAWCEDQADTDIDTENDDADTENDDDDAETATKSIVKRKYRDAYKPHQNTCGDAFVKLIDAATKTEQLTGKSGKLKMKLDTGKLVYLAKLNDVWKPGYRSLNNGQMRMTVGLKLRKLFAADTIKWV